MRLNTSGEFLQLERWLIILIETYKDNPTCGLAKTINYYIDRLLHHEDIHLCGQKSGESGNDKRCEYLSMKKFWGWQAKN